MARMDPVTQSALGASLAQTKSKPNKVWVAAILGCIAGLAPDLDVLIFSSEDPLLFLEYHRQFTHSSSLFRLDLSSFLFFAGNSSNTALLLKKCTYFVFLATQLTDYWTLALPMELCCCGRFLTPFCMEQHLYYRSAPNSAAAYLCNPLDSTENKFFLQGCGNLGHPVSDGRPYPKRQSDRSRQRNRIKQSPSTDQARS